MKDVLLVKLFITVNIDVGVKKDIAGALPAIKARIKQGRFIPTENMHITLLYLGEVERTRLSEVENILATTVKNTNPFELRLEGMGVFPNENNPNILWAGVKGELESLNKLYDKLLGNIKKTDLPYDAKPKYSPHVTLARKIGHGYQKGELQLTSRSWQVNSLELYESISTPNGVQYRQILSKKFTLTK